MNCLRFAEFFNWMQNRYPNIDDIYVSKLQHPDQYSIEAMSLEMRTKAFNEVSKKIAPINETYEKTMFLYKEHMLSTAFDTFNIERIKHGLGTLTVSDRIRGNNHLNIIDDFLYFFQFNSIDPTFPKGKSKLC
jgi:hypothetical protein